MGIEEIPDINTHHLIMKQFDGVKDFKCKSCGKSFSRADILKKHIHTVHEGHKDYNCQSCGKSFSESGNLKKHIHTIHDGHKDYACEFCEKLFTKSEKFEIAYQKDS